MEGSNRQKTSKPLGQIEDEIMKTGALFFGEELLKWLGVKQSVKRIAPTELVHLEARKMYQDFNYEMKNGWWYHIEFESDPSDYKRRPEKVSGI